MHSLRVGVSAAVVLVSLTTAGQTFSQEPGTEGRLHAVWEDPIPGKGSPRLRFFLSDAQGAWLELRGHETDRSLAERLWELDRARVRVSGDRRTGGPGAAAAAVIDVRSVSPIANAFAEDPVSAEPVVVGSQPWVTIACRFAGSGSTPHPTNWYESMLGSTYPGLDAYWQESSFGAIDIAGSRATGWYDLPEPKSAYMNGDTPNLGKLRDDCAAAADADVFFPAYAGVNFQFNENIGCCSWGGSMQLGLDGEQRYYRATWMAPWADFNVYAHEMGHGLGLPHSSGPYGNVYDSNWDVMSRGHGVRDGTYGWIPPHTIGYHKDLLGWLDAGTVQVVSAGQSATVELSSLRGAAPPGTHHMVRIPVSADVFYTLEARRTGGYDNPPDDAVVIHLVGGHSPPAQVVDPDNDGNPNDDGAMWLPGETFVDAANDLTVRIEAQTSTGYRVTIDRGGVADPNPLMVLAPSSLAYEATEASDPPSQNFSVRNDGGGTLDYTVSVDRTWLGLSRASGSLGAGAAHEITVSVDASGLSAGAYSGSVTISGNADNSPQTVSVTLTITAQPAPLIALSPASISVDVVAGGNPVSRTLTVQNSGTGTLDWSISSNRSWLTLQPTSGSLGPGASRSVTGTVDPSGLAAGTHVATVAVTGNASNSPQTMTFDVTVTAQPAPLIALDPGSLSYVTVKNASPAPESLTVRNSGSGTLDWTASTDRNWLSVNVSSGSLGAGASQTVSVSVNASSLNVGTHSGAVSVTGNAGNSPQTVGITVEVLPGGALISLDPSSLEFQGKGNKKPPPGRLKVANTGTETLDWTAAADQTWLQLGGTSGSLAAGGEDSVKVEVTLDGLEAGTHTATLTVNGNAENSPQSITVELRLTKGMVLKIKRGKLNFAGSEAEEPMAEAFVVENEGQEEGTWTASADRGWIVLDRTSGTLPAGATQLVAVGIDLSGLPAGTHGGKITVLSDSDTTPQTIDVALTLVDGPGVSHAPDNVAGHLLGTESVLTPAELFYLDQVGNGDGRFDVGDMRAWLMQRGDLPAASAFPALSVGDGERPESAGRTRTAPDASRDGSDTRKGVVR